MSEPQDTNEAAGGRSDSTAVLERTPHDEMLQQVHDEIQGALAHPAHQVYFRAGLIACREYMARFVEAESPAIAASIRANWWPDLGPDMGPPRLMAWEELTEGEYGEPGFRCKEPNEISPTLEALPIAEQFLMRSNAEVSRGETQNAKTNAA
jgi:hypothetical protein